MKQGLAKNIISLVKLAGIVGIPLLLLVGIGVFKIPDTLDYIKEILGFGFFTVFFFSMVVLFSIATRRYLLGLLSVIILSVFVFIKLSFYHNYGVKISASALYVIFETDTTESSDFLSNYFDGFVILTAILFLVVVPFVAHYLLKTLDISGYFKWVKSIAVLSIVVSLFLIHKYFESENIIWTTVKSYTEYTSLLKDLKTDLAKPLSNYVTVEQKDDTPETHVVIIGESTSNWHMQLYGYNRPTNPRLSEIKDDLLVFDSVIAPHVHTIVSLDKMLTFSDIHSPNKKNNTSIVQLANAAGFDTYWISNQRPVGMHERISSIIAHAATEKMFVATNNSDDNIYDEALLPVLDTVLKKPSKKKMIFLHLIGTHGKFKSRFPEHFQYFKDRKVDAKFKHDKAFELINDYDNAIRYNDSIVREVIDRVKSEHTNSFVVYMSDHGDELFDTLDMVGHNEYWATRPMYEVPFIAWFSEDYKTQNNTASFENYTSRAYILEDFIYTFSDLAKIRFKQMDSTKSIFSSQFIRKPRLIKNKEDYDKRQQLLND
ncbi:sulfatase-like hydrolase/transferase [Olleya aquimaris]|uniref:Heptose-I-phosphate ethanolaminephosphotransferase n=1 Tax=Olleya aquimaris TaxID=639310 RepID=A0A327RHG0_9FLAO|nr:sulfatase-like hydrolase/transferase [Olleya aquimaris]RAJ16339.1 heptose-I-phosphate ethanolaminephosphotransferase [Olleya aquimaris]